ncbi:MAG: hypothetical protein IJ963_05445 [Phascolarctobacterium sp.]|nr:hypothetical protein [Phascolarctobacterium sp.]MBR6636841.1 hypothetical protein [Phascolarctobacterium sp.]
MELKSREIGSNKYYVREFPPLEALKLLGDLQAVVTSSLGSVGIEQDDKPLLEKDINVGSVIAGIGGKLDGATLVGFADRILKKDYVSVQRESDDTPVRLDRNVFDEVFAGRVSEMLQVMYFVLEVNYSDFFGYLPSLSGVLTKLAKKK